MTRMFVGKLELFVLTQLRSTSNEVTSLLLNFNLSLPLPLHPIPQMTKRPSLTRELLEGMKRADLQRVCKVRVDVAFTSVNSNPHALNRAGTWPQSQSQD